MTPRKTIDVHAHILTEETVRVLQREVPSLAPRLTPVDESSAVLEVGGITQRPFPRGAWDLEWRLRDMAGQQVDVQVLSNVPHTFLYDHDPDSTATFAAIHNDQVAAVVKDHPERFRGLATLPLQAPERAAAELHRAMRSLGLGGAQIGTHVGARNLDDPSLEPVWAAAHELNAFILVHPYKVAAIDRLQSYYLKNLIGNPLETTIAVASLVFGGVVARYPGITFCFAHGGGFAPYQLGRFRHGWQVRAEPKWSLPAGLDDSLGRLCYDTILHGAASLEFLVRSAGAARVLLGSDYPFDMGQYDGVEAVRALSIPQSDQDLVLGRTASRLLGAGV
jgi:aminocarboxymuconate-semialdehyde decarboxylase